MRKAYSSGVRKKRNQGKLPFELAGLFLFLFGLFVCIALSGQDTGLFGTWISNMFRVLFGTLAFVPALVFIYAGILYMYKGASWKISRQWGLAAILYWLVLAGIHHVYVPSGRELSNVQLMGYGGLCGGGLVFLLRMFMGYAGTSVMLLGLIVTDILFMTHWSLSGGLRSLGEKTESRVEHVQNLLKDTAVIRKMTEKQSPSPQNMEEESHFFDIKEMVPSSREEAMMSSTPSVPVEEGISLKEEVTSEKFHADSMLGGLANGAEAVNTYMFPPLSLLHKGKSQSVSARNDVVEKAQVLENTLKSFGISIKITNVSIGPSITRYELEPAPGVKVSRIVNLSDDIALQLAAARIRIEAPIPGKSAVGIEVPNKSIAEVPLRDVLESSDFVRSQGGVHVVLGENIAGRPIIADLTKMPHLLIAGSTGSGKSVCINAIIMSILFHSQPDDVKLILIDPKVVELSVYNGIPHLRTPVVTDSKKAAGALHWAVKEMESRYQLFSGARVRDITGYNKAFPSKKMPFVVIIIDELADLMQVASSDVEESICRLAQKARAAGIHLVLATQRPSVDVITGIIKANIPSRISFAVSSQVDSRTILDMAGAERLIGKGDMLFAPIGAAKPVRVQGAFVSDEEVEKVTQYIKSHQSSPADYESVDFSLPEQKSSIPDEEEDELLQEAAEWILDTQKASVSMLQRRFRIGYTRAGRLMDTLENMGIVGRADGAKPRDILMNKEQVKQIYFNGKDPS